MKSFDEVISNLMRSHYDEITQGVIDHLLVEVVDIILESMENENVDRDKLIKCVLKKLKNKEG